MSFSLSCFTIKIISYKTIEDGESLQVVLDKFEKLSYSFYQLLVSRIGF